MVFTKEFVNSFIQQACVCAATVNLRCAKSSAEMRTIMKSTMFKRNISVDKVKSRQICLYGYWDNSK